MERRVFLAIFLSFLVLVVYQTWFAPPPPPPQAAQQTPAGATAAPGAGATPTPAVAPSEAANVPTSHALVGDTSARDITVDTDAITAVFNTRGGVLTSYRLKQYRDHEGQPLELLPQGLSGEWAGKSFALATDDQKESATLATALFKPSADSLSLGKEPGTLTFEYRDDAGLSARKTFYFQPDHQAYVINLEASVDVNSTPRPVTIKFAPGIGLGYNPDGSRVIDPRAFQSVDGSIQRLTHTDLTKQSQYEGAIPYTGVDDHYFLAAALPKAQKSRVNFAPVSVPVPGSTNGAMRNFVAFALRPEPGAAPSGATASRFFIGPKDFDQLRGADPDLVRAIDFGMFRVIVVPLLQALKWVHGFVGNWGWAIVVLTILINILIFPMRHRSMVSMKKMQAIQPQVKAIQDRYAKYKVTDPERQKMNTEMLALYKQKGVHPASGCLPMLLTMPILLAFYNLLSYAIELRGAPFVGWIHDLSVKDPTYVWPILMGATMFWQQRMMPTTADPVQQKIFLLMPVIFTFMFLTVPSGLVVYWLVSNLMTIGQQYMTNRIMANAAAPRPAAGALRKG